MHILVIAAWTVMGVSLTTARTIEESARDDVESERIIRGVNAAAGQFPYAAALHYKNDFKCTASILSPTTIMTAAHCVVMDGQLQPASADSFHLIANVNRMAENVRINVSRFIAHPKYNRRTIDNDVAILKTVDAIPFGEKVGRVCIAGPDTNPMEYRNATAMGWGNTSRNRVPGLGVYPEILQYVKKIVLSNFECVFPYGYVDREKLCAKGLASGVCDGDSGGPLVHLSADKLPVQIGIASYLNALAGCGTTSAVFARVSSYYDFIMETAQDDSICVV